MREFRVRQSKASALHQSSFREAKAGRNNLFFGNKVSSAHPGTKGKGPELEVWAAVFKIAIELGKVWNRVKEKLHKAFLPF